jgi:hypothetical protein
MGNDREDLLFLDLDPNRLVPVTLENMGVFKRGKRANLFEHDGEAAAFHHRDLLPILDLNLRELFP